MKRECTSEVLPPSASPKSSSCTTRDKADTGHNRAAQGRAHGGCGKGGGGASHREAHVCELLHQPGHDPGLVLLARCFHALEPRVGGESP